MSRYKNTDIVKKEGLRKYRNTIVYPIITPKVDDIYIIAQQGDRLDNLAWEYYENPTYWWIIARANNIGKGLCLLRLEHKLEFHQIQDLSSRSTTI